MDEDRVTCEIIEGGVQFSNGIFKRNILLDTNSITNFRTKYNNTGIFLSAYKYSEKDPKNAFLDGDLYFDFDIDLVDDEAFDLIKEDVMFSLIYLSSMYAIPKDVVDIYFSGNKGIHLIVKKDYLGIEPHSNLNRVFKSIAEEIANASPNKTMDLKVYDKRRLWRVANSKHNKSGLYKIPITLNELSSLKLKEIKELAAQQRFLFKEEPTPIPKAALLFRKKAERVREKPKPKRFNKDFKLDLKRLPPCINELLNGKVQKGQRNNSAIVLASFFRQQGSTKEECLGKLTQWNYEKCEEPLPQREIDMAVQHVYSVGYQYGCSGIRVLSTCNRTRCPLSKY